MMKNKGYEVIGAFMKNWSDTKNDLGECSWRDERKMALQIASSLDIPLITLDYEKEYRKEVVGNLKCSRKYKKGINVLTALKRLALPPELLAAGPSACGF